MRSARSDGLRRYASEQTHTDAQRQIQQEALAVRRRRPVKEPAYPQVSGSTLPSAGREPYRLPTVRAPLTTGPPGGRTAGDTARPPGTREGSPTLAALQTWGSSVRSRRSGVAESSVRC